MLNPRPLPSWGMIKLVASPNRKCELGNQTYTKRCALCSRTQCPSEADLKNDRVISKNMCIGILELVYRRSPLYG